MRNCMLGWVKYMTVREYLNKIGFWKEENMITFVKTRARKDVPSPFYHAEYCMTPVFDAFEISHMNRLLNCIILNDEQCPIKWLNCINEDTLTRRNGLLCLLVIEEEDFQLIYSSEEERRNIVEMVDKKIRKKYNAFSSSP